MRSDARYADMLDEESFAADLSFFGNEGTDSFLDLFNSGSISKDNEDSDAITSGKSYQSREDEKIEKNLMEKREDSTLPEVSPSDAIQLIFMEKMNIPNRISLDDSGNKLLIHAVRQSFTLEDRKIRSTQKFTEGKLRHISAPYDDEFLAICHNDNIILHPVSNGFMPKKFWEKMKNASFGWCLTNFFQKKNNLNARFCFKLYNALQISALYPELSKYIGVSWVTKQVIKVNKYVFGRLLGIKMVDNSFFHQQGNFPAHGFQEITHCDVKKYCPNINLDDVDYDAVRLFIHTNGTFHKGCKEEDILDYKFSKGKTN